MNFTIGNRLINNPWRQVKAQYGVAICGLTLALVAAVGSGGVIDDRSVPLRGLDGGTSSVETNRPDFPATYFLVDTQQQADRAHGLMSDEEAMLPPGDQFRLPPYRIVFAGSEAAEGLVGAPAGSVSVVDLRGN